MKAPPFALIHTYVSARISIELRPSCWMSPTQWRHLDIVSKKINGINLEFLSQFYPAIMRQLSPLVEAALSPLSRPLSIFATCPVGSFWDGLRFPRIFQFRKIAFNFVSIFDFLSPHIPVSPFFLSTYITCLNVLQITKIFFQNMHLLFLVTVYSTINVRVNNYSVCFLPIKKTEYKILSFDLYLVSFRFSTATALVACQFLFCRCG